MFWLSLVSMKYWCTFNLYRYGVFRIFEEKSCNISSNLSVASWRMNCTFYYFFGVHYFYILHYSVISQFTTLFTSWTSEKVLNILNVDCSNWKFRTWPLWAFHRNLYYSLLQLCYRTLAVKEWILKIAALSLIQVVSFWGPETIGKILIKRTGVGRLYNIYSPPHSQWVLNYGDWALSVTD